MFWVVTGKELTAAAMCPFLSDSLSRDACCCLEQHLALARGGLDFRSPCPDLQVQGFRCVCITMCSVCFPDQGNSIAEGIQGRNSLCQPVQCQLREGALALLLFYCLFVFKSRDSLCRSCSSGARCVNLADLRMRAILLLQSPKH